MNRFCLAFITLLVANLFFSIPSAVSGDDSPRFKVAIAHWPPWKMVAVSGFEGIDIDILAEVGRRANVNWEYIECPWRRCLEMLKTGAVDIITSIGKTEEREAYLEYLGPYYNKEKIVFYRLKGSDVQVSKYNDIYDHTIGLVKGSVYFEQFDNDWKVQREAVTSDFQHLQMLLAKRVDLVISYETIMAYSIANLGWQDKVEKVDFSHDGIPSYFAISKYSPLLNYSNTLADTIQEMVESGTVEEIKQQFMKSIPASSK
ncbi:substrate-binding periplasmic protein [Desulfosediminicola flagellatus]|uniref:substrate-binding periplasmic protein n=1 Tax=Desulfosediminicola flagellatus TaxID=2569541 RepID=UPI0010ABC101|nr:transporter substrate-binding domain-containing protein [Desulfosediminicola flagellatus]